MRASIAGNAMWAREPDRTGRTSAARAAFLDRFERQIDEAHPDVAPEIRAKMAEHARKAYFLKLALKSSRARAARKAGGGIAD